MESYSHDKKPYKVPFNILICDVSEDDQKNTSLLQLVLGNAYSKLKTTQLSPDEISYIHKEWKWLFTPTNLDQISIKLIKYSKEDNLNMKHSMLLFKTRSIAYNIHVQNFLKQVEQLPPDSQPMTVFITDSENETKLTIDSLIGNRKIDKLSFYLIHNPNDNDILLKMIYIKFYIICSYYNQLGDQYLFSNDLEDIDKGISFNQRFNILIVGRPGSGKSTFINKLLGEKRCLVGGSMSQTNKIVQYHHSKYLLSFYDTPGFENEKDINNAIQLIAKLGKEFELIIKQIHLIIYLVNAQARTMLKVDEQFLKQFHKWRIDNSQANAPLVFLVTKSKNINEGKEKCDLLSFLLQNEISNLHYEAIFPIEMADIYQMDNPFGIKQFMEWLYNHFLKYLVSDETIEQYQNIETEEEIYDLNSHNYFLSKMISKNALLKLCYVKSNLIVFGACMLAGGEGFIPIPFLDTGIAMGLIFTMVKCIFFIYGINYDLSFIKKWILSNKSSYFGSLFNLIGNGLKFIPGIGTLVGGLAGGAANSIGTQLIGASAISHCESKFGLKEIKKWCKNVIKDYNHVIESFNQLMKDFDSIEIIQEKKEQIYEDD